MLNPIKSRLTQCKRNLALWLAVAAVAVGSAGMLDPAGAAGWQSGGWYQAVLEAGETEGWRWAVGAKGRKHEPLQEICLVVGVIEPLEPGSPEVRAGELSSCGHLRRPTDSVSSTTRLDSEALTALHATLYRPIVSRVIFVLGTGERRVYRTAAVKVARRVARGIPVFRYLVVPFDGETCIRRIVTHDSRGAVIKNEIAEPGC
jgi:hypothetical protein